MPIACYQGLQTKPHDTDKDTKAVEPPIRTTDSPPILPWLFSHQTFKCNAIK